MRLKLATVLLVLVISGCVSSGVSGTYVCTKGSGKLMGFDEGDVLEFKSNKEVYIKSSSGQGVVGSYEVSGNKINIELQILGTRYVFECEISGDKIICKDGSVFEKK